jgi:cyclopropane fatty-acyl-phospholipid synthase-like methyltransferase
MWPESIAAVLRNPGKSVGGSRMLEVKDTLNGVLGSVGLRLCKKTTIPRLTAEVERLVREEEARNDVNLSPLANFTNIETVRLTKRRQEHLASLGLPIAGGTVLEVGAGIGEHTTFFLDRGCKVLSTDGRSENLEAFRERFDGYAHYENGQNLEISQLDLDAPPEDFPQPFDIIYCYGVLYHLSDPGAAISFLARQCSSLFLLETSVSLGDEEKVQHGSENPQFVSQSIHGQGCHPTRPWIFSRLKEEFPFVYMPTTQPWHDQFPLDWTTQKPTPGVALRAVFVASRHALESPLLGQSIPARQIRC